MACTRAVYFVESDRRQTVQGMTLICFWRCLAEMMCCHLSSELKTKAPIHGISCTHAAPLMVLPANWLCN